MATTIKPVFYTCKETTDYLDHLEDDIRRDLGKDADLLLDYPGVYVHVWRSDTDVLTGRYSIYIGESNDIVGRTREHWYAARLPKAKRSKGNWQYHMVDDVDENGQRVVPTVYFFGHKLFQKSMTLDIENRMIDYCLAMETAHIYNGRTNPQGVYSGSEEIDNIFSMIWKILRKENSELFLSESSIQKSAIFKASPNHKLTQEQKDAKTAIIERTYDAIVNNKTGQLIFVEGEAGTGKTVLTSSAFYEIMDSDFLRDLNAKCFMLINHEEQKGVYENMARKLLNNDKIIQKPTSFLKSHSIFNQLNQSMEPDENNIADVVFIDEAHLLWNQSNQSYDKKFKYPQLEEIIRRARVTVIMYDDNQILHRGQIYEGDYMDRMRKLSKSQGPDPENGKSNYIVLSKQLRMNCSEETMKWVDTFTKGLSVSKLSLNSKCLDEMGYEIKVFDDPKTMHDEIIKKAAKEECQLSRVIATCDWKYINTEAPKDKRCWIIEIGNWSIPWHEEIFWRYLHSKKSKREIKRYKAMNWAEKDYSVNEAGSIFTIQGFDLAYAGVILGPSVKYDKKKNLIWFDEDERAFDIMKGKRTLSDGKTTMNITHQISMNELRVLMTRATKGLYIYACDDELREALFSAFGIKYTKKKMVDKKTNVSQPEKTISIINYITKETATKWQMEDIRAIMDIYGITEEETIEAYNKSMEIPFNPDSFDDWDE